MTSSNKKPLTCVAFLLAIPSLMTRHTVSATTNSTIAHTSDCRPPDYSSQLTVPDCQDSACDASENFYNLTQKNAYVTVFDKIDERSASIGGDRCSVTAFMYPGLVTMSVTDNETDVEYGRYRLPEGFYTLNDTRVVYNTSTKKNPDGFYFNTDDYTLEDRDTSSACKATVRSGIITQAYFSANTPQAQELRESSCAADDGFRAQCHTDAGHNVLLSFVMPPQERAYLENGTLHDEKSYCQVYLERSKDQALQASDDIEEYCLEGSSGTNKSVSFLAIAGYVITGLAARAGLEYVSARAENTGWSR